MKKSGVKNGVKDPKKTLKSHQLTGSFTGNYWQMFDVPLFGSGQDQVLNIIGENLASGREKYWVATVNPEFLMAAGKDGQFKKILQTKTDLNVVDGIGIIWARELKKRNEIYDLKLINKIRRIIVGFKVGIEVLNGKYRKELAAGADLMGKLAKMSGEKGWKIFLLGGFENRAEKAAESLKEKFKLKDNQIEWCAGEPYVSNDEVVKKINKFKPDILLVAYGMKKQELWIGNNLDDLSVRLVMGVGRSFDYYSGELKRAPEGWRKLGLEWLYSLLQEPKRFKRQLVLPKFIWKVLNN